MERALLLVRLRSRAARTWHAAASFTSAALVVAVPVFAPSPATAEAMPHVEVAEAWSVPPYEFAAWIGDEDQLWASRVLNPPNAAWFRVHFNQFQIGPRDYVKLIGEDGSSYTIEGREIEHADLGAPRGKYYSLFFNGSSLTVEFYLRNLGGAVARGNGLTLDFYHYGTAPPDGGSTSPCNLNETVAGTDGRIGRLIALQEDGGSKSYQICTATLLFPGDCVVTDGSCLACPDPDFLGEYVPCLDRPGVVDFEESGSLIVEFDPPAALGTGPRVGAVQHPGFHRQYRLLTSQRPCVDETSSERSDYAVFVAAPNEISGFSPSTAFSVERIDFPVGGELVVVEGFPEQATVDNHTQIRDDVQHSLATLYCDPNTGHCTERVFVNSNRSVGDGSEGSPVISGDGRKLYAILNEPACIADPTGPHRLTALGYGFDKPGIDPEREESCVNLICNSEHGFVPWPMIHGYVNVPARQDDEWSFFMSLPGGTLQIAAKGILEIMGGAPVFRGDKRLEIDLEITSLSLEAVSCLGPVSIELDPTRQSLGTLRQLAAGPVFPAENFFDVFLRFTVGGAIYTNRDPVRLSATTSDSPPYDVPFTGPTGPIVLYDAQGAAVGSIENVQRVTRRPRDRAFSSLRFGLETVSGLFAGGTYDAVRGATHWDTTARKWSVPTELVAMDLRGVSPPTGHYVIRESPTQASLGAALFDSAFVIPGSFPAKSFFDVFFEIEMTDQGRTLVNQDPLRLEGTIRGFPPTGDTLRALNSVQLYDRATGQPAGLLQQVLLLPEDTLAWVPPPVAGTDAHCGQGRLILDLGQGITTVDAMSGGFQEVRGAAVEQPNGLSLEPLEMTLLGLHKDSTPFGPMNVRVQRAVPSSGTLEQTEQGTFFPATASLEVFLEIETPQGVLHNSQALTMSRALNALSEPEPQPYQSPTGTSTPLLSANNEPAGTLHAMWVYPGILYDPTCPGVSACGSSTVGVSDPPVDASIRMLRLRSIQPNPARDRTQVAFDVPVSGSVRLRILDVAGRVVKTLSEGWRSGPQRHRIEWDGTDTRGLRARSGVYFVTLESDREYTSQKHLILR